MWKLLLLVQILAEIFLQKLEKLKKKLTEELNFQINSEIRICYPLTHYRFHSTFSIPALLIGRSTLKLKNCYPYIFEQNCNLLSFFFT